MSAMRPFRTTIRIESTLHRGDVRIIEAALVDTRSEYTRVPRTVASTRSASSSLRQVPFRPDQRPGDLHWGRRRLPREIDDGLDLPVRGNDPLDFLRHGGGKPEVRRQPLDGC